MASTHVEFAHWETVLDSRIRDLAIGNGQHTQAAWGELVRRHSPAVARAIEGVLSRHRRRLDGGVVEDLIDSTWLLLSKQRGRKLRKWNPRQASLGHYFAIIGMGVALTWCRYMANHREVSLDHPEMQRLKEQTDGHLSPVQTAWLREAEKMVQGWEARLKPHQRDVLRLCREGVGQVAIGRALCRSQASVSSELKRLRTEVESLLEGLGV